MNTETPSDAWNRFNRAWEVLRNQWNDQNARELERRWTSRWGGTITNFDASLRKAEAFAREVDRIASHNFE